MDHSCIESPIGHLALFATARGVAKIQFCNTAPASASPAQTNNPHLIQLRKELAQYFAGKRQTFKCALDIEGTEFQKSVWTKLAAIPFGQTRAYGEIAIQIGNPNASRAVGGANNKNPVPIILPCHRVVGANHALVGYAGEIWRKTWLLEHEGIALPIG